MHNATKRTWAIGTSQDCAAAPTAIDARASMPWLSDVGDAAVRLAATMPEPLRKILRALPPQPPSFVLARLLDRVLLPRLDSPARAAWSGRVVQLDLDDLGLRLRMRLDARGFAEVLDLFEGVYNQGAAADGALASLRGMDLPGALIHGFAHRQPGMQLAPDSP